MEPLILETPHWEALTPRTRQAFQMASRLSMISHFYLAGGTGLALHLGHRFSVDLDFFSQAADAVGPAERAEIRSLFDDPSLSIIFDKDATFVATWQEVGISFFSVDRNPLVRPTLQLEGVPVACIEEIGAMKLAAMIGRGTRKDYVDMFFILQHTPIEELFKAAAVKYRRVHTFAISAVRALAYFEDAEAQPMPRMLDRTPWSKMKLFLEHQALEAGRKRLEDLWR